MKNNNFSILFWGFTAIIGYVFLGFALPIILSVIITPLFLFLYIPIVALGAAFIGYLSNLEYEDNVEDTFWYKFIDLVDCWF